jgi:MYXO-CTERM domain-containing protein
MPNGQLANSNAPDLDYVRSIGGIESCFHPVSRPQGAGPDVGAYEYSEGTGGSSNGGESGGASSMAGSATTTADDHPMAPEGGGCACRTSGSATPTRVWLLALTLACMGLRRRRCTHCGPTQAVGRR